ncbi:M14 family zinc carboxypeptidase [Photobacterium leiognathi]|uniref:M14 family zinc carboxypeptidase n=1 Tax=Photobacterium leiognathi TaxID=553611 RepID=UPI0029821800|nr:M14 family zinc carboxypeptidase [Photobacterium leiognathi]
MSTFIGTVSFFTCVCEALLLNAQRYSITKHLPEFTQLEALIDRLHQYPFATPFSYKVLANIPSPLHFSDYTAKHFPLYAIHLGTRSPTAPLMLFVGGVHGLERIGSQVLLSYLHAITERLVWDRSLQHALQHVHLVFIPLVNPVGMAKCYRSNGNHIDLMRNAPVECSEKAALLVGGHRLSPRIPWYRGQEGQPMEIEAAALASYVIALTQHRPVTLSLDCHSGFGVKDRLWFPYAHSAIKPFPYIGDIYHLRDKFLSTYPNHNYVFEPQALHYLCHGDLWDHISEQCLIQQQSILPLTLEMGSWRWIKKNPLQLRQSLGIFNPMRPQRVQRVLQKHIVLMDFLINATANYDAWFKHKDNHHYQQQAIMRWYS